MVTLRLGNAVERFGSSVLAPADVELFRAHGYLALPRILPPSEVEAIALIVGALFQRTEPKADGMLFDYATPGGELGDPRIVQLLLPFDYAPELFDTKFFRDGAAIARALLGEPIVYRGSHAIDKPGSRDDNATAWHQDEAFWDPGARHEAIAIWLPLAEVTAESGPMCFVPGSHRAPDPLPHRRLGADRRVHALEVEPGWVDATAHVACPVPLGGATIHHCRTVHGTGPNRGAAPRRALVLNFALPATTLDRPRDFPWQAELEQPARARRADRGIELP